MTTWTRETSPSTSALTINDIVINGTSIGHVDDTDLLTLSSGTLTLAGNLAMTGALSGLTAITVDNVIIDGTTIGHTSDGDLMTLASAKLTVSGDLDVATKITAKGGILMGNGTNSVNTVTIASGVADISLSAGGYIQLTSESSTSDNLDSITVGGATPTNGYILYLRPTNLHTITVRTGSHSAVTDGANSVRCNENVGDTSSPFNMTLVTSFDLSSVVNVIHLIYAGGRWVVLGHDVDVMRTGE